MDSNRKVTLLWINPFANNLIILVLLPLLVISKLIYCFFNKLVWKLPSAPNLSSTWSLRTASSHPFRCDVKWPPRHGISKRSTQTLSVERESGLLVHLGVSVLFLIYIFYPLLVSCISTLNFYDRIFPVFSPVFLSCIPSKRTLERLFLGSAVPATKETSNPIVDHTNTIL